MTGNVSNTLSYACVYIILNNLLFINRITQRKLKRKKQNYTVNTYWRHQG